MLSTGPTDHCSVTLHFLPPPSYPRPPPHSPTFLVLNVMCTVLYTDYLLSSHGFKVERYGDKCLFRSTLVSYKFMDSLFFFIFQLPIFYFLAFPFHTFLILHFCRPFLASLFIFCSVLAALSLVFASLLFFVLIQHIFFSFCFIIYFLFCFSISFFSFCFSIFVLLWRNQCIIKNCLFLLELQILLQAV